MNEVTHIEIPDVSPTDYQIDKKNNTVEIQISALDPKSVDTLQRYSDQFIKKITVVRNASLSRDVVSLQLNDSQLEMFDYLTDAPSSLSIDFYKDDQEKIAQNEQENDGEPKKSPLPAVKKDSSKEIQKRSIASSEFIKQIEGISLLSELDEIRKESEGKVGSKSKKNKDEARLVQVASPKTALNVDAVNFKLNSIIENRGKLFISFPILLNEDEYLAQLLSQKVEYEVEPSNDSETKDFIKTKRFFSKGDYRNFLKVKNIFIKKYPTSKFSEMVGYMEAESYFNLYKKEQNETIFDQALKMYDGLLSKYPKSNLSERTLLLVSYLRVKKGKYMEAVRNLKLYSERYKSSPLLPNIELIMAQCLLRLQEYEDSLLIYQKLLSSEAPDVKEKAHFDLGDVFFEKKDYAKAIKFYNQALTQFPAASKKYPNVFFNLGEAQFLSEEYKQSLSSYKQFIDHFPQHDYAAYAWTRMGEVLEAADVDPKLWKGYYNESYFRFQNTNGGLVAKINLLSHQAMDNHGVKFDMVISEMRDRMKKLTIQHAAEFTVMKISDTFFNKGEYKKATDELMVFFKEEKIPAYEDKFLRRIGRGISFQVREYLSKNNIDKAFSVLDSYDSLWERKSKRYDFNFLRAQGFEKAHLYKKAISSYEAFLSEYKKLPTPNDMLEFEQLPLLEETYLALANCYFQTGQHKLAEERLSKATQDKLAPSSIDSWYLLSSKIANEKNEISEAIDNAEKIKQRSPEVTKWLSDLYLKNNQPDMSIATIDKYLDGKQASVEVRFSMLKSKLDILDKNSEKNKYYDFLKRFHGEFKNQKFEYDREKYKLGSYYAAQNKVKEAEEVWNSMDPKSYWKKMAMESSDDMKWNDQYKKYINRIPAMVSGQEKAQ